MRRITGAFLTATLLVIIVVTVVWRMRTPEHRRGTDTVSDVTSQAVPEAETEPTPIGPVKEVPAAPATGFLAASSSSPFVSEEDYLRELDRLNQTDKRRALELVRQGHGWYSSSGVKAEARQAMGITLLVDLGEMEEARALTRKFIAEHPTSTYRHLVQGVTGIHPRPTGPNQKLP